MKTIPLSLTSRVLFPARLCTITRRDGEIVRAAEAQNAITVGADTWSPISGLSMSAIRHTIGGDPADMTIAIAMSDDGPINLPDVVNGKFDSAVVHVDIVDRKNPVELGRLLTGLVGPIRFDTNRFAQFDVRGEAAKAVGNFAQTFGAMCRTDLGSPLCKIPLKPADVLRDTVYATGDFARVRFDAEGTPDDYRNRILEATTGGTTAGSAPSFTDTIDGTTSDGSVTWTTRNSWSRHARVDSIENEFNFILDANPDAGRGVTGWFNGGVFLMHDGPSANRAFEVGGWVAESLRIVTYLPLGAAFGTNLIEAGDWLEIWPGCDFTIQTCATKFSNAVNFRGEPYFLGADITSASQA